MGEEAQNWASKLSRHYVFSIGAFKDGKLIAYAKVNRRGAVYWFKPWPGEKWEVE